MVILYPRLDVRRAVDGGMHVSVRDQATSVSKIITQRLHIGLFDIFRYLEFTPYCLSLRANHIVYYYLEFTSY